MFGTHLHARYGDGSRGEREQCRLRRTQTELDSACRVVSSFEIVFFVFFFFVLSQRQRRRRSSAQQRRR